MKSIAPMLGVRESRRLDGAFKLTVEDLRRGTEFADTIGYSMYGWDLPTRSVRASNRLWTKRAEDS